MCVFLMDVGTEFCILTCPIPDTTVLYCTVLYCMVLYCIALYCIALCWLVVKWQSIQLMPQNQSDIKVMSVEIEDPSTYCDTT